MGLTQIFKEKMRKDTLISELSYKLQLSSFTIRRWIKEDDKYDDFTHPKYMELLKEVSGLQEHEIIEA
jgi:hypothetical protein